MRFPLPALLLAAGAMLAAGCGTPDSPPEAQPAPATTTTTTTMTTTMSAAPTKPYRVEELAAGLGCQPEFTMRVSDYRQATCQTPGARFVLLDFTTTEGLRGYLEYAELYGGIYLVGERWAMSGLSREHLDNLRITFGGQVEGTGPHP